MSQDEMKKNAAKKAIELIEMDAIVGVGTGSTVNFFIEELAKIKHKIEGAVASSKATETLLRSHNIPVCDLNSTGDIPIYVDGADEFNQHFYLIKGGGGALTREKIVAAAAKQFICIADSKKQVNVLGKHPLAIEVIPMARSYVARQLVKLGADPTYRDGFISDNGNVILDAYHLDLTDPITIEKKLNNIAGIVCHGLFAQRTPDKIIIGTTSGTEIMSK